MAATDMTADVEALKKDLQNLRNDLKSLRSSVADEMRNGADRAAEGLATAARHTVSSVAAAGEKGYSATTRQIEANPLTSVLIAAGLGFVIGSLMRR
jgi:ElaB/YqjD/DUF883 family membrane-anchored ribosome-binding protein